METGELAPKHRIKPNDYYKFNVNITKFIKLQFQKTSRRAIVKTSRAKIRGKIPYK